MFYLIKPLLEIIYDNFQELKINKKKYYFFYLFFTVQYNLNGDYKFYIAQ